MGLISIHVVTALSKLRHAGIDKRMLDSQSGAEEKGHSPLSGQFLTLSLLYAGACKILAVPLPSLLPAGSASGGTEHGTPVETAHVSLRQDASDEHLKFQF